MPLANLSERFYQKFGHDLVEELVTWLNQMDTTYRSELRELNELNFARFDAKLEQRVVEVRSELRQEMAKVREGLAELRGEFREALKAQTEVLVKWILGIWLATLPALGAAIAVVQHFLPARP